MLSWLLKEGWCFGVELDDLPWIGQELEQRPHFRPTALVRTNCNLFQPHGQCMANRRPLWTVQWQRGYLGMALKVTLRDASESLL